MKEESVVAQRAIADSIRAAGCIEKVTITKELQMSTSCARQRYVEKNNVNQTFNNLAVCLLIYREGRGDTKYDIYC